MTRARLAGPLLIVGSVLAVLHPFVTGGSLPISHPDVLPFWLPTHCFLGSSLAAGHIPAWNPHVMGGVPFAADPQSGWMYMPAMALYSTLSCGTALRWFIVLQPLIAGLALYAFLRTEGLSRPAATVGGLALALPIAGSLLARSLPFAGALAWTAVALLCAARLLRAERWSARLGWTAALAVAWGQILSAHPSHGLLIGTAAVLAFLAGRFVSDLRAGRRTGREVAALGVLVLIALPLVNLGILLPRLAYVGRTTLALGHARLDALAGVPSSGSPAGIQPAWPLGLALAPGAYLGAASLALAPAAWRVRRWRPLAASFAALAAGCYLLALQPVTAALTRVLPGWAGLYLHLPQRFALGLLVAVPVLAALGLEAWRAADRPRARLRLAATGILAWSVLTLAAGADAADLALFGAGGLLLLGLALRPRAASGILVACLLGAELVVGGLLGLARLRPTPDAAPPAASAAPSTEPAEPEPLFTLVGAPTDLDSYLRPGPIARALLRDPEHGRYASVDPRRHDPRGPHVRQAPADWGFMATQRSMLFGLEEAQGYNPAQPIGYWRYLLATRGRPVRYNAAQIDDPSAVTRDLLRIGWLISPSAAPPEDGTPVAREGTWTLYRLPAVPSATLVPRWKTAGTLDEALAGVLAPGFDPEHEAIVEGVPALRAGTSLAAADGTVRIRSLDAEHLRARTDAQGDGILLVRINWDAGWRARVDGAPAAVLRTDAFLVGVAVPAGSHEVTLSFVDPMLGRGLLGSGLAFGALLVAAAALARRERASRDGAGDHGDREDRPSDPTG